MKKLMCFLVFLFGCGGVTPFVGPAVTGAIVWRDAEARKYYREEPLVMLRALKSALRDLNYPVIREESHRGGGFYVVAGSQDRFKITIRMAQPHVSEVRVRVGLLGDKPYAEFLFKHIDVHVSSIEFDDQGRPVKLIGRHPEINPF